MRGFAITVVGLALLSRSALAAPEFGHSNLEGGYSISTTDLINVGQSTLVGNPQYPSNFDDNAANDGVAINNGTEKDQGLGYWGTPQTLTFLLNTDPLTGGSEQGYDITNVIGYYGWRDSQYRFQQNWTVSFLRQNQLSYDPAYVVNYNPILPTDLNSDAAGSTYYALGPVGTNSVLASHVVAVRFYVTPYTGPRATGEIGVLREFDVFGVATVPEPASLCIAGMMAIPMLRRRRR